MPSEAPRSLNGYIITSQFKSTYSSWKTYKVLKEDTYYVMKSLQHSSRAEQIIQELKFITPNSSIVQFIEHYRIYDNHFLVFQYCERNLTEFLENAAEMNIPRRGFDLDNQIIPWMTQFNHGLVHLHEHGIAHGNLQPSNIFFSLRIGELQVKIGDYQPWIMLKPNGIWLSNLQTPSSCWNAPETWPLNDENVNAYFYRQNIDSWSLGCFGFTLVTWEQLFLLETFDKTALKAKFYELRRRNFIHLPENFRNDFAQLLRKLLRLDPNERPWSHEVSHDLFMLTGQQSFPEYDEEIIYTPSGNENQLDSLNPVLEPDLFGVFPPVGWARDLSIWQRFTIGEVNQLHLPPMRVLNSDRILEIMIVRPSVSPPPNATSWQTPDVEAVDSVALTPERIVNELQILARLCELGAIEDMEISVNLVFPFTTNGILFNNVVRKTREVKMGSELKDIFLLFQPIGATLSSSESPRITVKAKKILRD